MTEFVVHSVLGSPFGRAALAALETKGAPYRLAPVDFNALRSQPHLERHPFGKVPVLEHGDFVLYETQAILRYIDRVLPAPALTPADPKVAARMDQAIAICDGYLFPRVGRVIAFNRFVGPNLMDLQPDEAALAKAVPRGQQILGVLGRLLGTQPFIAGDEFSLADILLASHLHFLSGAPDWPMLTAETPNLVDYAERIKGLPSFVATSWKRIAAMARAA